MKKWSIHTDGASRGNPGLSSYGFVITSEDGTKIYQEGKYIGIATNNIAEYTAVLQALRKIKQLSLGFRAQIELYADSKLVVEQLSGRFKIKSPHLKVLIEQIKGLEAELGKVSYAYIPRSQNSLADRLANLALDSLS